jgi:phosphoesterase RecJ-like protein
VTASRTAAGIPEAAWDSAVELLRSAAEVDLVAHVNPDADSLGSALALGLALRALGTPVRVTFGCGSDDASIRMPDSLAFLPGADLVVPPARVPAKPEVLVVLDTASRDRLGVLGDRVGAASAVLVVDHHRSSAGLDGESTYQLVDVTAPATGVLVEQLIGRLGAELTTDIATALYAAIASDTGSFRYAGTTPATHLLAARLLAAGVRQDQVSSRLWDEVPVGYLHVLAGALAEVRLEPEAAGGLGLVWTVVGAAARRAHGIALDAVEGIIDVVRKAREAQVAAVLREDDHGALLVSLRSRGRVDVGTVAAALGGGGHLFAAGFTAREGVDAALAALRAELARARPLPGPPG